VGPICFVARLLGILMYRQVHSGPSQSCASHPGLLAALFIAPLEIFDFCYWITNRREL